MVLIKLQGGLGNQMFQFAAVISFIQKGQKVHLDHHFLEANQADTENFTARKYELSIFKKISISKAKKWQTRFFTDGSLLFRGMRQLLGGSIKIIRQQENEYIPLFAYTGVRNLYLDGYFQSEQYFYNARDLIRNCFTFPDLDTNNLSLKAHILQSQNPVSVHVRRGDYLRSKNVSETHGVLPISYYQKALVLLKEKYISFTLFIFSDDIDWVKRNLDLTDTKHYFIDNNHAADSWKDMALMTCCKHHIIANSSFSWWGAWLSEPEGVIFAPRNWFNPQSVNFDINNIIPAGWTVVDND